MVPRESSPQYTFQPRLPSPQQSASLPAVPHDEDTTTPTAAANLVINAVTSHQVNLSWDASNDDTGVTHYKIYRDTILLATVATTEFDDLTVLPGNTYLYSIQAFDAAANASPSVSSSVTLEPTSLWTNLNEPTNYGSDGYPLELGIKLVPKVAGRITGVKFYKAPGDTGEHIASLWQQSDSSLLARGNFTNETASGWQTMVFDIPVDVDADEIYVASYSTSSGMFGSTHGYFLVDEFASQYITAPATNSIGGNGVYATSIGLFPSSTYGGNNYWADVLFIPSKDTVSP